MICVGGVVRLIAGGLVGGLGGGLGIARLDHLGLEALEVFDCGGRIVWFVPGDLRQCGEGAVVFDDQFEVDDVVAHGVLSMSFPAESAGGGGEAVVSSDV